MFWLRQRSADLLSIEGCSLLGGCSIFEKKRATRLDPRVKRLLVVVVKAQRANLPKTST